MDGRSAPFKVTTLDTLMAEQLQKDEYRQSDLIVARIGQMVDDSFWKEIHGGADTIERDCRQADQPVAAPGPRQVPRAQEAHHGDLGVVHGRQTEGGG